YSWGLDPNTLQSNPLRPYSLVTARVSNLGYDWINGSANASTSYQQFLIPVTYNTNVGVPISTYANTGPNPIATSYAYPVTTYQPVAVAPSPSPSPALDDFVNVAHAFWAILIAVGGGWLTGWAGAHAPA